MQVTPRENNYVDRGGGPLRQSLLRRLCPTCKEEFQPISQDLLEVGINPRDVRGSVFRPRDGGCEECLLTGYRGRTGIYELLTISDRIRSMVVQNLSSTEIRNQAVDEGMTTLRMDGANKFLQGLTSLEEVIRITQEDASILEDASVA